MPERPTAPTPPPPALSPEMARAHQQWRALGGMPRDTIGQLRDSFDRWTASLGQPDDVSVTTLAGGTGLVVTPASGAELSILHLHGGAFRIGSASTHRLIGGELAKAASASVSLLDYPLAPEHPFPAALNLAVDTYRALIEAADAPEQVAISGDSAGGGLALATLLVARNRGIPLCGSYIGMSPWVDLTLSGASHVERAARDPFVSTTALASSAASYAGPAALDNHLLSPLFADLTGLPPMLIHVGSEEILYDDATRLHDRAAACGVQSELTVVEGAPHVWHQFAEFLPEAREALRAGGAFIRRHARYGRK